MKKQKMNTGITLVALIITIVILIILAVVSITTIMNTDMLGYANKSVNSYEKSKDNETETMQGYEDYLAGKGESDSKGSLLKLIDVPQTTSWEDTYLVDNGIIKITTDSLTAFSENSNYIDDVSRTIQLPCSASLKSGVTYEIKLDTIYRDAGFYGSVSLVGINSSKINYDEGNNSASTVFTCEKDANVSYIDFVFTPSDNATYLCGVTEDGLYGGLLAEFKTYATAQYRISIVEK